MGLREYARSAMLMASACVLDLDPPLPQLEARSRVQVYFSIVDDELADYKHISRTKHQHRLN